MMKKIEYFVEKFDLLSNKIGKHNVMLIAFITVVLLITGLYSTFSLFTTSEGIEIVNGVKTYKFILDPSINKTSIIVPSYTDKNIDIVVTNNEDNDLMYGVYYNANGEITIGSVSNSSSPSTGIIKAKSANIVSVKVKNTTGNDITVNFGVSYGFENGGELKIDEDDNLLSFYPEEMSLFVKNLYNSGSVKKTVNIGGDIANPTVSLNEEQGLMLDNNGEYRYYGKNPNNYVWYNNELWRIISVSNVKTDEFDEFGSDRIKIVKASPMVDDNGLATYSWDSSDSSVNSGSGVNDWSQADLMNELNDLYFYQGSGTCYTGSSNATTNCSFVNTGLSPEARSLTSDALYYLGSDAASSGVGVDLFADDFYTNERGTVTYNCSVDDGACPRATKWAGIIGLMYASDYAYATDLSLCNRTAYYYDEDASCYDNNWISKLDGWLITPNITSFLVYQISSNYAKANANAHVAKNIHPVVYLDADVIITGGDGSEDKPYQVAMAKTEKAVLTVNFDANGGEVEMASKFLESGSLLGELPEVTREGYTFNGWYTKKQNGEEVTEITMIEDNQTIYATWSANSYNVTFNANGGIDGDKTSMEVTYDSLYGTLPTPTREGYNFLGWFTGQEGGIEVKSVDVVKITSDTILYAHWKLSVINITFDPNGGSVDTTTAVVTPGEAYGDLPTPSRTGYSFNGWYTASSGGSKIESTTTITLTDDHTLYAQWTINTYTVSYYNGTTLINTSSHTYGTAKNLTTWANLGATVTNSSVGWSFAGWSTSTSDTARTYANGVSVNNLTATAGGNINLYAVYSRTITFKHGASAASSSTATQYWNSYDITNGTNLTAVTSPTLTAVTNWTASGFRNDTTASSKEYDANGTIYPAPDGGATLYGVYTRSIAFYSGVSKASSHGSRTQYLNSNSNTVSAIKTYTPTTITNWTSLGFRDDTTAGAKEYAIYSADGSESPAYTTGNSMYAVYSRTLTISYNGNSNTGGSTGNTTKTVYLNTNSTTTSSQAVTLAANGFSRTGHTFSKWAAGSAGGTQYAASASYTPNPVVAYNATTFGVTMFAVWTANTYTVTFNANGGSVGTSTTTVTYDSTYGAGTSGALPTPTRTDYKFNGWYTAASGGEKITSTSTVSITSNTTLYAQWTVSDMILYSYGNNYSNFYLGNDGSPQFSSNSITFTNAETDDSGGYVVKNDAVYYPKDALTVNVLLKVTSRQSSTAKMLRGKLRWDTNYATGYFSKVSLTLNTELTISKAISVTAGTTGELFIGLQGENTSGRTSYYISGEIYKIWFE